MAALLLLIGLTALVSLAVGLWDPTVVETTGNTMATIGLVTFLA